MRTGIAGLGVKMRHVEPEWDAGQGLVEYGLILGIMVLVCALALIFFIPANAPSLPSATSSRSLSLPTISITKSASFAAAAGVGADLPPCFCTHASAFAPVRL